MYKKLGFIGVGLAALAIGTILTLGAGRGHRSFGRPGSPPPLFSDQVADKLGMTDDQRAESKRILEDSKTRIEPLIRAVADARSQHKVIGNDGSFDETKVNEIAGQLAESARLLFIEKAKTKAQFFAILTPEQRERAKQIHDTMSGGMKGRFRPGRETPDEKYKSVQE